MKHRWTRGEDFVVCGAVFAGKTSKEDRAVLASFLGLTPRQIRGRMQNYMLLQEKHKGRWNWSEREKVLYQMLSLIPDEL